MDDKDYSALDALETEIPELDALASNDIPAPKPPRQRNIINPQRDAIRSRLKKAGIDVPDDVYDDFERVAGLESGRQHFSKPGVVKRGPPTGDGSRAIGYGQIMPGTAAKYQKYGLDPMKELDNRAMSIAEFYQGSDDPIGRRIAYVAGPKAKALQHYKKTGEVPDWKLYSYMPKNKETFRTYVEKSGGMKDWASLDALSGDQNGYGYAPSGAPQVDFNVGGAIPDAGLGSAMTDEEATQFEQMFGKKPVRRSGVAPSPVVAPAQTAPGLPPSSLPPSELPPAPAQQGNDDEFIKQLDANVDELTRIGQAAAKGERYLPSNRTYEFEKTGKIAGGKLVYKGKVGEQYTAQDPDGDAYVLDEQKRQWIPADPAKRAVEPPKWVTGKTKPVTQLPPDPVLQKSYQVRLDAGLPDTEELRQKFVEGYTAVKSGKQQSIFTQEELTLLDLIQMGRESNVPADQAVTAALAGKPPVYETGEPVVSDVPRSVGQTNNPEEALAETVAVDPNTSQSAQAQAALSQLSAKYGFEVTPELLEKATLAIPASTTGKIDVTYGDLARFMGNDSAWRTAKAEQRVTRDASGDVTNKLPELNETDAEKEIDKQIRSGTYSTQQKAAEYLGNPMNYLFGGLFGDKSIVDVVSGDVSEEWVAQEKKRLKDKHGSYGTAHRKELEYQGMSAPETIARFATNTTQSFVKNVFGGTAETLAFVDSLVEQYNPSTMMLPEGAKPSLRNVGNGLDFVTRLITGASYEQAVKDLDYRGMGDASKSHLAEAAKQFKETIGSDPVLAGRLIGMTSDGLGSAFAFIALGAAMPAMQLGKLRMVKGAKALGGGEKLKKAALALGKRELSPGVSGAAMMAGPGYIEGKEQGLTEGEAQIYGAWNAMLGLTELFGAGQGIVKGIKNLEVRQGLVSGLLEAGKKIGGKAAKGVYKEGGEELFQETAQTVGGKAALEFLKERDKPLYDRVVNAIKRLPAQVGNAVANEGVVGAITGGVLGGGGGVLQGTQETIIDRANQPSGDAQSLGGLETVPTEGEPPPVAPAGSTPPRQPAPGPLPTTPAEQEDVNSVISQFGEYGEAPPVAGGLGFTPPPPPAGAPTEAAIEPQTETATPERIPPSIIDIADEIGVDSSTIQAHLDRYGFGGEKTEGQFDSAMDQQLNTAITEFYNAPPDTGFEITQQGETKGVGVAAVKDMRDMERRRAETDPLTGVANRAALDRALPRAEEDPDTAVIAFDANNFGKINKVVSEMAGDEELKNIANALTEAASEVGGRVFRKGGDEFTILAPKADAEKVKARAEQLYGQKDFDGFSVSISGAVGNTFADADALLQDAKAIRKGTASLRPPAPTEAATETQTEAQPMPPEIVGKSVEIDGVGQGQLVAIRGGKAVIDYQPRTVNGRTVYGKRDSFDLDKVAHEGTKLSTYAVPASEKPTGTQLIDEAGTPVTPGTAEQWRSEGKRSVGGVTYERSPVINEQTPRGASGRVIFSNEEEPEFHYQLIEREQLTPADLGGNPNPKHFMPEAQPKDRSGKASKNASDKIASNMDFSQVAGNRLAYSGAPIVNSRGEVIQGNNRSEGIWKHYQNSPSGAPYKGQLAAQAAEFGFTKEQVEGMNEPVLVRMLDVDDATAIKLGNYDAKDVETGGVIGLNPVATSARIPFEAKSAMLQDLFRDAGEGATLNQQIRQNTERVGRHLKNHITSAQYESMFVKGTTNLTPQGLRELEQLFTNFLFDKGHPDMADRFAQIPQTAQQAIIGSMPAIFSVPADRSMVPDIQNGISAAYDFLSNRARIDSFEIWRRQADMFADGLEAGETPSSPNDQYTPLELKLAQDFIEAKIQREIKDQFKKYAALASPTQGDMFTPAGPGMSKSEAVKEVYGVDFAEDTQYEEETATNESGSPEAEVGEVESGQTERPDETPTGDTETESTGTAEADTAEAAETDETAESEPVTEEEDLGSLFDSLVAEAAEQDGVEVPKETPYAETVRLMGENAAALLEQGPRGQQFLADVDTALQGNAETPAQKTIADMIAAGTFPRYLDDFMKAVQEGGEYAPETAPEYVGPQMSRFEIAVQLTDQLMAGKGFANITEVRKIVGDMLGRKIEAGTPDAKMVDEAVELAVVSLARSIASAPMTAARAFDAMVELYERQPNLAVRTSTSIKEQAYSTPAPLAFIASRLAGINSDSKVYEPSAGNGMLLIEADPSNVIANEINEDRAENLRAMGFTSVRMDGTVYNPGASQNPVDVVIANPPFGQVTEGEGKKTWQIRPNYKTQQIDHAIAFKALESMKDDGKAVLILGGIKSEDKDERFSGYQGTAKRQFYFNLYKEYNVIDHFTVSGDLYKKQGAGWPVDVIVIEGRGKATRTLPAGDIPKVLKTWDEVKEKLDDKQPTGSVALDTTSTPARPNSPSNSGTGGANAGLGSVSGLSSGQNEADGQQGTRPASGSGSSGTNISGKRPTVGGPDFSDSSEHGRDPDNGQSGTQDAPVGNDRGSATADNAADRPEGSTSDRGDRSGGVGLGTANVTEPKSVKEFLNAASEDTKKALDEAAKGLSDLFGDNTTFGIGPAFSNEVYQKAKPHFEAAYQQFKSAVKNAADAMRLLFDYLKNEKGWPLEKLMAAKEYITEFAREKGRELAAATAPSGSKRPSISPEEAQNATQLPYYPQSNGTSMTTLVPANMYDAVVDALEALEEEVGNIDDYVTNELGYKPGEIFQYFGGEQIDAIALSIRNMKRGSALVLGDQTGIGKGRVVAGVLRWAIKQGKVPIFLTEKDNLYKDIYRDLVDIGMDDLRPLMVDAGKNITLQDETETAKAISIKTPTAAQHDQTLRTMMDNGAVDPRYNIIFGTYYAIQNEYLRKDFLRQFANDTIMVMDESHNAGGTGAPPRPNAEGVLKIPRSVVAREMVANAQGVLYSSATWAKRPNVMSLYSKTDMRLAVADINQLGPAIEAGGIPLQQVVASMLARSGQYLRRERTFDGISYDTPVVPVDREKTEEFGQSIREVYLFSQMVREHVKDSPMIWEEGSALLNNPAVDAKTTSFASLMHNVIAQALLALKVEAAADLAIKELEAGRKPVLTFANTMGAMIEETAKLLEWTPGDAVNLDFGQVILRYLDKARTVTVKDVAGNKLKFRLTDDMLGPELTEIHDQAKSLIRRIDWSGMPASPTDYLISRFEQKGYKVGEITGRSDALQYNPDGTILYRRRPGADKTAKGKGETIRKFNNGEIDVMLLNQSGSTGLSLHASEKFSDQRKRIMILVQAEANIDTHMQMLGRINRTGQVIAPGYFQLVADIPAERRPAGVLAKKMASLNANTTGATDSAVKAKDTLDFINMYGDRVVAQYLSDNSDIHDLLGNPLPQASGGLDHTDAATKATGKLPMLSLEMQEEFYDAVGAAYESMIEQLNQLGENKLEAQTLPLEAVTLTRTKIYEGPTDSDSPFAAGAYAERVQAKKLTRPRPTAEVLSTLRTRLNLGESADIQEIGRNGRLLTDAMFNEWLPEINAFKEEQVGKRADEDKKRAERTKLDELTNRLRRATRAAPIGSTVEVTLDGTAYYGVVANFRRMGRQKSPLALSDYEITVFTTDATRQLSVPVSQVYSVHNPAPAGTRLAATFRPMGEQPDFMGTSIPIIEAFDTGQSVRTEERWIMTGNILASYGQFDVGRVINFTTHEGELRQGILMPGNFDLDKALTDLPVRFETQDQIMEFLFSGPRIVESTDGQIRLSHSEGFTTLMVPKGASGSQYHQNEALIDNAGDFVSASGMMAQRRMNPRKTEEALRILMDELGTNFHTNVFKPQARELVGDPIPQTEIVTSEADARVETPGYEEAVRMREAALARVSTFEKVEFNHTRTNAKLFVAKPREEKTDDASIRAWGMVATRHGGYYSGYSSGGAIPGFLFKTETARQNFIDEIDGENDTMLSVVPTGISSRKTAEELPLAGDTVDGLKVRDSIPNQSSISASFNDYTVLDGVREVPMSLFSGNYERTPRTIKLAAEIEESGKINPLIVAFDDEGAYILEGGHRYDALGINGAKSIPALVVIDEDASSMFSLAGENGVSNLPDARGRLQNLEIAKAMEKVNKPADRIWMATGWERGADGQWRTEINDYGLQVSKKALNKTYGEPTRLIDAITKPGDLFKAYPELANAAFTIKDTITGGSTRTYQDSGGSVFSSIEVAANLTPSVMNSVLQHEIQHAIQQIEGFARGGSTAQFIMDEPMSYNTDEVNAQIARARQKYRSLAGEAEARNVQTRRRMTAKERQAQAPADSTDIPYNEQLVITEADMRSVARDEIGDAAELARREEEDRRHAIRILKNVPIEKLLPTVQFTRTADRIKLNLSAMELLRRAFEKAEIDAGRRPATGESVYPAFLGVFPNPGLVDKAVDVLGQVAATAKASGFRDDGLMLDSFKSEIEEASRIGKGTLVFYVLDKKLPQEIFHQGMYLGSVDKALTRRHHRPDLLDNSIAFKKADEAFFSKQPEYSVENIMRNTGKSRSEAMAHRQAIIREEIAAWAAEGSFEEIGLTADEADNYLLDFIESFADKIYYDHRQAGLSADEAIRLRDYALEHFMEIDYAQNAIKNVLEAQTQDTRQNNGESTVDPSGNDESGAAETTEESEGRYAPGVLPEGAGVGEKTEKPGDNTGTEVRPDPDASRYAGVRANPGVRGRHEKASYPGTMRAAGAAASDVIYTVFSDRAAQVEADRFLDEYGLDGAIERLMDDKLITNPDVHHAIAAFMIQKSLQNEAARIEATNPEAAKALIQTTVDLGTKMSTRMIQAGRFIRAASVLVKNTQSLLEVASDLYKRNYGKSNDLPEAIKRRIEAKIAKAESDLAQHEAMVQQLEQLKKRIADLEKLASSGGTPRSSNPLARGRRSEIVRQTKVRHREGVEQALEKLRNLALIKPSFSVNNEGDESTSMFSVFEESRLDPAVLDAIATVGADILLDGLESQNRMTPGQFDELMKAEFGDEIAPHLEIIHRESLRRRNNWLADMTKENQVKAIIREFGDDISDEDIEAILLDKKDALLRRAAIMRLHSLRAEKGRKVDQLTAIEALIAEIAPNEAAATAASALIHHKPSAHELYRFLEADGITGADARNAIRQGTEVLEKAKLIHAKREAELKQELRDRINADNSELQELEDLVSKSRTRVRESQYEIQKELERIGTSDLAYYAKLGMETLNTPRALMASGDVSFLLRQGGWFMLSRPGTQKAALRAMIDTFGIRMKDIGYDRAMAEMEANPMYELAVQSGIDFAGLGKHGEFSITKGEEEFRNNIFGMIADLTKDSKYHKLNIARAPNAWIKKSDEIYTAFLDAQRLAVFTDTADYFVNTLGLSFEEDPKEFKALADYINDATGRSTLPGDKESAARLTNLIMNLPLFAPRFTISRFKLLYKSTLGLPFLPKHTRKVVMRDAAAFYIVTGGLTALAWMAGISAGLDWDDSDFLKIRIGDNHLDLFVGMQQALRPTLRLTAMAVRSAVGGIVPGVRENVNLYKEIKNDKGEVIGREQTVNEVKTTLTSFEPGKGVVVPFIRQKLSPVFSLPFDRMMMADAVGQPFTWQRAITTRLLPLGPREVVIQTASGNATNALLSTASILGVGYSNYPRVEQTATTDAERLAKKINSLRFNYGVPDADADAMDTKLDAVRAKLRSGLPGDEAAGLSELSRLVDDGEISSKERTKMLKGEQVEYFERAIARMPLDALQMIQKVANEGEKVMINELVNKRVAKVEAKASKARARVEVFGEKTASDKSKVPKSLAERLAPANVADALVMYQENRERLTSAQRLDMVKKLNAKIGTSAERNQLGRENFEAAQKLLGDEMKLKKFTEPKQRKAANIKGIESLQDVY